MEGGATYALETVRPSYDFDDDVEMAVLSCLTNSVLKKVVRLAKYIRTWRKRCYQRYEDDDLGCVVYDLW